MKRAFVPIITLALVVFSAVFPSPSQAQFARTNNFFPVADASIRSDAPGTNNGGSNSVFAGVNSNRSSTNHALFRFDLSFIPTNATVNAVSVSLIGDSPAPAVALCGLSVLLTNWVETGVTWSNRASSTPWTAPGGQSGTDFAGAQSALNVLSSAPGTTNQFTDNATNETVGLVHDVQTWVNHPAQNFGWILAAFNESSPGNVVQFGSRENSGNEPVLTVSYTEPFTPPTLKNPTITNGQFCFSFNIEAGHGYQLQRTDDLSGTNWETFLVLDPAPTAQDVNFCDPSPLSTTNRFYRVHY